MSDEKKFDEIMGTNTIEPASIEPDAVVVELSASEKIKQNEQKILELISKGNTIKKVCEIVGVSLDSLWKHRAKNNDFDSKFHEAREISFEVDADSLKTAHEDIENPAASRLYSENIRWLLARRKPSQYGDRLDITHNQTVDIAQALREARNRSGMVLGQSHRTIDGESREVLDAIEGAVSDGVGNDANGADRADGIKRKRGRPRKTRKLEDIL